MAICYSAFSMLLLLVAALLLGVPCEGRMLLDTQQEPFSAPNFTGRAFFFGAVPKGKVRSASGPPFAVLSNSCGYGAMSLGAWPYVGVAGISPEHPWATTLPQMGCGICLMVNCTDSRPGVCKDMLPPLAEDTNSTSNSTTGPLVVQVVDTCLSCKPTDINLWAGAFDRLADLQLGTINVTYQQVPCQPPGNITIHVSDLKWQSPSTSYIKLALKSVAGSNYLVSVSLSKAGLQDSAGPVPGGPVWRDMENEEGGSWTFSGLPPNSSALDMLITDASGQQVNIRNAIPARARPGNFPTGAQFQLGP